MKAPLPRPVKCNVCDVCLCYCARTYNLDRELSYEEIKKLNSDIEEIKRREEYLLNLRRYLESKMQRHFE
jgi:hypothetical protein